jgi:ABC-2 type transport system permease protein
VLRNLFVKTLRDQRRSLGWWSLGLLAVVAVYVLPYRTYLDSGVLSANTDTPLYQALGYDNSPAGYLQGALFALLGPLLLVMMAVAAGARAIAGDEEAGTLELLLAHPVSRTRLLLERFGALAAAITLLGLVVWGGALAAVSAADMGIGADRLAAATLGLVLLALGFGTVALAAGAASGRRGLTFGVTGWGEPAVRRRAWPDPPWVGLLVQLLAHQDAPQVTRARAAWPLKLGWKKSRLLTWLALN